MKVLVTAASRHGSTEMIADCIREELEAAGCRAHLVEPDGVADMAGYDALVLGSAVYAGHWLKPARKLVDRLEGRLDGKPVWLFSSGPVGMPARPVEPPVEAVTAATRLHARGHQVFPGRIDRDQLGAGERLILKVVGAQSGDDREWIEIGRWARSVAAALRDPEAAAGAA